MSAVRLGPDPGQTQITGGDREGENFNFKYVKSFNLIFLLIYDRNDRYNLCICSPKYQDTLIT